MFVLLFLHKPIYWFCLLIFYLLLFPYYFCFVCVLFAYILALFANISIQHLIQITLIFIALLNPPLIA